MMIDDALEERINMIIDKCENLDDNAIKPKVLSALNQCIFVLTGTRPQTFVESHEKGVTIKRADKRGCVSCKEKMLKAVKSAGEIVA